MYRQINRICISAASGSAGKTLIALGLCRAFKKRNLKVKPYKKGPDYIDAAWLSLASSTPAANLDPFFLQPDQLKEFFLKTANICNPDLALMEGNRGLYDGLDDQGSYSTAAVARILDFPIILAINCSKGTRTIAAILKGLTEFEKNLNFAGVILNNIGSIRHEQAVTGAIRSALQIPVLGCLPRLDTNPMPERHMGLSSPAAIFDEQSDKLMENLGDLIAANCDLDKIMEKAKSAAPIIISKNQTNGISLNQPSMNYLPTGAKPVIGYVKDKILWFYYPENLEALKSSGAELLPFSVEEMDEKTLKDISGLYLGGGFPEDFTQQLVNSKFLGILKSLAEKDLPVYAECGGLILLCESIFKEGKDWPMSGVLPLKAKWHKKPQGLGYVEAEVIGKNPFFPQHTLIRGHEFHYSCCSPREHNLAFQLKLKRGKGIYKSMDGLMHKNTWGAYLHIFAEALPCWAENFVKLAKNYSRKFKSGQFNER